MNTDGESTGTGADEAKPRIGLLVAGGGALMLAAGLLGADQPLARLTAEQSALDLALSQTLDLLDLVSGKEITNFLLGFLLIIAGLGLNTLTKRPLLRGRLLYVGAVQFVATTVADLAKPPFGRFRPFQALNDGRWTDHWFMGAGYGSFPSGHAAFYAGLFVPLAVIYPRWAAPLLALPLLIGFQRVSSHDHYLSDVGASFVVAGLAGAVLSRRVAPGTSEKRG